MSTPSLPVAVIGSTGQQGGDLARNGAEVAVADLDDGEALRRPSTASRPCSP